MARWHPSPHGSRRTRRTEHLHKLERYVPEPDRAQPIGQGSAQCRSSTHAANPAQPIRRRHSTEHGSVSRAARGVGCPLCRPGSRIGGPRSATIVSDTTSTGSRVRDGKRAQEPANQTGCNGIATFCAVSRKLRRIWATIRSIAGRPPNLGVAQSCHVKYGCRSQCVRSTTPQIWFPTDCVGIWLFLFKNLAALPLEVWSGSRTSRSS